MNALLAAAMGACLHHMSGGAYEKDFSACEKITIEYNREVETLAQTPAGFPRYHEEPSRQDDAAVVARAAAMFPN